MLQDRKVSLIKHRPAMASYDESAPSATRVGADLRLARERLGWTLPALAAHLRIRLPYLEALEEGRIGDLPAVAYAVGFLRTYATILGLDPDEMSRRFRAEVAEANRKTELNFPAPVPDRGVPAGAVILVGAMLAIVGYVGWYRLSEHVTPVAEVVPPVPAKLAAVADRSAPPPLPVTTTPAPAPAAPPKMAATEPPASPVPSVSPSSAAAATTAAPERPAAPPAAPPSMVASLTPPEQATSPTDAAAATIPPVPPAAAATPPHLVVQATADAWIQVRQKGGHVLLNRVLRSGETWTVPDEPSLLLTTGNAGGTEVLVDGVATPPLGRDGAVRRDLPLNAEAIKAGRLAPPARHS